MSASSLSFDPDTGFRERTENFFCFQAGNPFCLFLAASDLCKGGGRNDVVAFAAFQLFQKESAVLREGTGERCV